MGNTTRGTATKTIRLSLRLVINIRVMPPTNVRALRRAKENDEPITVCRSAVSVVILLWISPDRLSSKKEGGRVTKCR